MKNTQAAPFPAELAELVEALRYKQRWVFKLEELDRGQGSKGLTLVIRITTPDSYEPSELRSVLHYFPVPPAAYSQKSWCRWLFDQILQVEAHEAMEFFVIANVRPFAPNHGPGADPYSITELTTDTDRRTSYLGEVRRE